MKAGVERFKIKSMNKIKVGSSGNVEVVMTEKI